MISLARSLLLSPVTAVVVPFAIVLAGMSYFSTWPYYIFFDSSLKTVILYIFVPFILSYTFFRLILYFSPKKRIFRNIKYLNLRHFYWFFFIGSVFEILLFQGLPLLNILQGRPAGHDQFGLPTLHGFINLLYFLIASVEFKRWSQGRGNGKKVAIILLWPLLLVSRGMFMISLLLFVYSLLSSKKVKFRSFFTYFVIILFFVYFGFGALGSARDSRFNITSSMALPDSTSIYKLWLYVYIVSPLANLQNTINQLSYPVNNMPIATLLPLIPTKLKDILGFSFEFGHYSGRPVHSFLNASTGYMAPYLDYKLVGISLLNTFYGFIAAIITYRKQQHSVMALVLFNTLMVLNIFNINFFAMTFFLCLIILFKWDSSKWV